MRAAGSDSPKTNTWRERLAHAFALEREDVFSEADERLLARMADWLIKRRLGETAVLALETCRPLNFLGAQALVFLRPFVHMVYKKREEFDRFTELLEKRATVGKLIERIETRLETQGDATDE